MIENIIRRISSASGIKTEEIKAKIIEKRAELSNMISDEGAAHIVAKELGISLVREPEHLKIANIIPGMKNIDIIGKVIEIGTIRNFKTEKTEGRVQNIVIGDETGTVRISLWNNEIDKIKGLCENDTIRIKGLVKEDNMNNPEIRLGPYGIIQKSDAEIKDIKETSKINRYERAYINTLTEGQYKQIRAAIVHIFESKIFYETCPHCNARIKKEEDYKCSEHGKVEPVTNIVISGIADDGTGNIRIVLFKEQAEKLVGMKTTEIKKIFESEKNLANILKNIELGKEFIFEGRVQQNSMFDRLEFIVNNVKEVNIINEINMLIDDELCQN